MKSKKSQHLLKYVINLAGNPNSCLIKIGNQKLRCLCDSGAMCSLIHKRVYDAIPNRPKLIKKPVNLQSVNGASINCIGCVKIPFMIGNIKLEQEFFVVTDMNRNVILGQDWLSKHGVRFYHDLKCLRIYNTYVPLTVEDVHIASILRNCNKKVLKPQTKNIWWVKARKCHENYSDSSLYEISGVDQGFIGSQPGLMITNTLVKKAKSNKYPVIIVNNTNKTISLKKGCVIARIESVQEKDIISLTDVIKKENKNNSQIGDEILNDLNVPSEYREIVLKVLKNNLDLFASSDADLSVTDAIEMKIDTGDHPPIKQKPYRTPLHQREVVEKEFDEMLKKIIRKSRSNWSSPIVLIWKKDKTLRFCIDYRAVNKTCNINYQDQLPLIDDLLSLLGNSRYFSKCDLRSGY